MKISTLKRLKLPDAPGVYFFVGPKGKVLYIGKATSLRSRVRSYFSNDLIDTRGPRLVDMVTLASTVKVTKTDSVLEALILEANLVKRYGPPYNIDLKDDKSFLYVVITKEEYPRILTVRGKELAMKFPPKAILKQYGPFTSGSSLKEALRILRRIFPFFDLNRPITGMLDKHARGKLIFNQQIGLSPTGLTPDEYKRTIHHLILFFEGKKKRLLASLKREMKAAAKDHRFEEANEYKRQVFALTHIKDVSLIKEEYKDPSGIHGSFRVEAYDVAHLGGSRTVGVMTVVEDGEKKSSDYRKFKIGQDKNDDVGSLREVLERRLGHDEWPLPNLIAVDGGVGQVNAAKKVLAERNLAIPVVGVVKDERHKPREIIGDKKFTLSREKEILLANSEAHRFAIGYLRKKLRSFPQQVDKT